jgi:hypothetical protein
MNNRTPVVGGLHGVPMVDRYGTRLHVGDTIRYQHCTGPYGQTRIGTTVVTESRYDYPMIGHAGFEHDSKTGTLRGYRKHEDFEHGHEKWVEVVQPT